MTATISFFPVGNGDMTLVTTEGGNRILIDANIRESADAPDDDTPDVAAKLRDRLCRDEQGRLYVNVLLVSHPDEDHCRGLRKHFYLGPPSQMPENSTKILVREIWSSPIVFRRASRRHVLCEDARAFGAEARRRVRVFRKSNLPVADGDRILILGEDENGKTDDLEDILISVDQEFSRICGRHDSSITARLLAPLPAVDDDEEDLLSKNNSSTILRFSLSGDNSPNKCRYLTGGDAEVAVWEKLWQRHVYRKKWLEYDLLLAPHHCSWHSLSYDSWSEKGEHAAVCEDARNALSQIRSGGIIVASSNPIKNDNNDPPCIRAKQEYINVVNGVKGTFKCVCENPTEKSPDVMEIKINQFGMSLKPYIVVPAVNHPGNIGNQPLRHG